MRPLSRRWRASCSNLANRAAERVHVDEAVLRVARAHDARLQIVEGRREPLDDDHEEDARSLQQRTVPRYVPRSGRQPTKRRRMPRSARQPTRRSRKPRRSCQRGERFIRVRAHVVSTARMLTAVAFFCTPCTQDRRPVVQEARVAGLLYTLALLVLLSSLVSESIGTERWL